MFAVMILISALTGLKAEMVNEDDHGVVQEEQYNKPNSDSKVSSSNTFSGSHVMSGTNNTSISGNTDTGNKVSSASSIRGVHETVESKPAKEVGFTNNLASPVTPSVTSPVAPHAAPHAAPVAGSFVNPLTGQSTVFDYTKIRPVAVSLSNQRAALPTNATNGVSQADILYEVLVEAGITRFVAIYQDYINAGVIGSVRSARHYTVQIAEAYNAIFIHAGGSPLGFEEIDKRGITHCDEVRGIRGQVFKRDANRIPGQTVDNYHSVTTSGSRMMQYFPTFDIKLVHEDNFNQALRFTNNPIPSGERAHNATVKFSPGKTSTFTYSGTENIYYMSQYGSQFRDANNNAPVVFTNLLILETPVSDLVGHGAGAGRQDMSTYGSGKGYFVSGGRYVEINWSRASKSAQFVYTFEDGSEVELGRGKTYIGIVPVLSETSFN